MFCLMGLAAAVVGCGSLRYTAGVCDCDAPPVQTLLQAPQLPPHLCAQPQVLHGPPARMPAAGN